MVSLSIVVNQRARPIIKKKTGITRLRRWERAKRLGLDPPEEVKQIIERHGATSEYNERYVLSINLHLFITPLCCSLWTGHLSGIVSTR